MSISFTATPQELSVYEFWFTSHGGSLETNLILLEGARTFFQQSGQQPENLNSLIRLIHRSTDMTSMTFADFCAVSNLLLQCSKKQIDGLPTYLPQAFFEAVDQFAASHSVIKKSNTHDNDAFNTEILKNTSSLDSKSSPDPYSAPNFTSSPSRGTYTGTFITPGTPTSTPASTMPNTPSAFSNQKELSSSLNLHFKAASEASASSQAWDIPEERQSQYGVYFSSLDTAGKGYVTGAECFNLFVKSGLPQSELSKIWCLVTSDGVPQLKKQDFMVAMHLINERIAGKPIPSTLPPELVPPSRRSTVMKKEVNDFPPSHRPPSNDSIVSIASFATPSLKPTRSRVDEITKSPIHEEIKDLTQKTEQLTVQRMELTNQYNTLSIEKQNLTIKLGQVKAAHEAETSLVQSLRATVDQEKATIQSMTEELQALEKQRQNFGTEKQDMLLAQQKYKSEAEEYRSRIAVMNADIQSMRHELAQIKAITQKDLDNFDFFKQTAFNVEETKQRLQQQLNETKHTQGNAFASLSNTPSFTPFAGPNVFSTNTSVSGSPSATATSNTAAHPMLATSLSSSSHLAGSTLNVGLTTSVPPSPSLLPTNTTHSPRSSTMDVLNVPTSVPVSVMSKPSHPISSTPSSPLASTTMVPKAIVPPEYQKDFDQFNWDFPPLSPPVPSNSHTSTSASPLPSPSSSSTPNATITTTSTSPTTTNAASSVGMIPQSSSMMTTAPQEQTTLSSSTSTFDPFPSEAQKPLSTSTHGGFDFAWSPGTKAPLQDLSALGFTPEQVMEAIQKYPHDVQKATNYLLERSEMAQ